VRSRILEKITRAVHHPWLLLAGEAISVSLEKQWTLVLGRLRSERERFSAVRTRLQASSETKISGRAAFTRLATLATAIYISCRLSLPVKRQLSRCRVCQRNDLLSKSTSQRGRRSVFSDESSDTRPKRRPSAVLMREPPTIITERCAFKVKTRVLGHDNFMGTY